MNTRVHPGALSGRIDVISSKSQAHRALICAALADAPVRLKSNAASKDVHATARCIEVLGACVEFCANGMLVKPIARGQENCGSNSQAVKNIRPLLDCGESGSTLRFMLPLVGALGRECALTGEGLLASRPLSPLYEQLISHGMKISAQGAFPLECSGKLRAGVYEIAGNISSQFITGLLMALPLLEGDSEIRVIGRLESRPYVDMTLQTLRIFGINIEATAHGFGVKGAQKFHAPSEIEIEGDWSNASFWLAAGVLGGDGIDCGPLNSESAQGDRAIVDILRLFGANVRCDGTRVSINRAPLRGIELDVTDIPDLVPIISVIAGAAQGDTQLSGVARLRFKESDRVESVIRLLDALGVAAREADGTLTIFGRGGFSGGTVDSFNDHRIAMSAAIAGSVAAADVDIMGSQACDKSYPGFFEKYGALGGRAEGV